MSSPEGFSPVQAMQYNMNRDCIEFVDGEGDVIGIVPRNMVLKMFSMLPGLPPLEPIDLSAERGEEE